jgi:hypothetical protein
VERFWVSRARRLALLVNLGWVLDDLFPASAFLAVAAAAMILILRRTGLDASPFVFVLSALGAAVIAGSVLRARRRFFSLGDALARLDLILGLDNRLTSAMAGVTTWPEPRAFDHRLRWRMASAAPLGLAGSVVALALVVPVGEPPEVDRRPPAEPVAWTRVDDALEVLEDGVADEAALEEWRRQLEDLRKRPSEEWFEHSSLEAGDSLEEGLRGSLSKLDRDLARTEDLLRRVDAAERSGEPADHLDGAWKEALRDLDLGKLPIDRDLAKRLARLDPKDGRPATKEELEALQKALAKGLEKVRLAEGEGKPSGEAVLVAAGGGDVPGIGEPSRGRADAPLWMRPEAAAVEPGSHENVASHDPSRAAIGDVVGLSSKEHAIDEAAYRGPSTGGGIGSRGQGGEAVWRQALPPDEQEFLERYYR